METIARLHLDTFELTLRDIKDVSPGQLHALSVSVGWPHRETDWQMLLGLGQGLAAVDEIGRVVGTVMWLRYAPDFAMICMLITLPRLQEQGAGRWLMEKAHEANTGAVFGLNATREAKRLYRSLGYGYEQKILRCQGEAAPAAQPAKVEGLVRHLAAGDHDSLLRLDRAATSHDRSVAFQALLPVSRGQVLVRNDEIVAFALCRPFGRGHVIGPVVAATEDDAIAVSRPHVEAHAGRFLRADTPASNTAFTNFLVSNGMQIHDSATSMGLGRAPYIPTAPGGPRRIALASQALG
ncbi:GNAT family N-acetyltransferase [Hyphomicrobiales bacterium]|nr:GNAT family N-acetyltransferase [Hyphomicrobiales bacterium]CAH1701368.1 GNAT family N-acetyltransferase [Hyphomicrobiales bacterium]CAI0345327.1 GNAT family N-acetyltransferase [Hyphomicrobiales bacterium]